MKTQNNTQKTDKKQVSKTVLFASAVIFSLVLTILSFKAQDLQEQFLTNSNDGKIAMYNNEQPSESEKADAANHAINAEVKAPTNSWTSNIVFEPEVEGKFEAESALQFEEYNAKEFVDAEINHETENWINSTIETPKEVVEAESALQIEEYNARKFVDAEMEYEIENWMNSTIETLNEVVEAESIIQVEKYNAKEYVVAEMALEIGNWLTNEWILNEAETLTDNEVDVEIEKYAQKLILLQENNTEAKGKMANEDFFKSAEKETALEAEQHVEKYASRQIFLQQSKGGLLFAGN